MGGGCAAVGDYDGDDDLDLYTGRLYRNTGDNTFSDVTASAGIASIADPSSAYFGDLDGDKDLDLIAADGGQTRLYRKQRGWHLHRHHGRDWRNFIGRRSSISIGRYDRDGHLDIYIARIGANRPLPQQRGWQVHGHDRDRRRRRYQLSEAAAFGDYNGDGPRTFTWRIGGRRTVISQ